MTHLQALSGVAAVVAVCALLYVEECGIPMPFTPGDIVLVTAGSLAALHATALWIVMPLGYASCLLGALTCYTVSRRVGRPAMVRAGRPVGLTEERLLTAEVRLQCAGSRAVFAARLVPGLRIYGSVASGCLRLPLRTFATGLLPGVALWLTWCTLLGYFMGASVGTVLRWWDRSMVVSATVITLTVGCRWVVNRRRERAEVGRQRGAVSVSP